MSVIGTAFKDVMKNPFAGGFVNRVATNIICGSTTARPVLMALMSVPCGPFLAGEDDPEVAKGADLAGQKWAAGRDLRARGLVLRRSSAGGWFKPIRGMPLKTPISQMTTPCN